MHISTVKIKNENDFIYFFIIFIYFLTFSFLLVIYHLKNQK